MRFLANENFPLTGIIHLRTAGQDVVAVIHLNQPFPILEPETNHPVPCLPVYLSTR
jgi:hypothetical protein